MYYTFSLLAICEQIVTQREKWDLRSLTWLPIQLCVFLAVGCCWTVDCFVKDASQIFRNGPKDLHSSSYIVSRSFCCAYNREACWWELFYCREETVKFLMSLFSNVSVYSASDIFLVLQCWVYWVEAQRHLIMHFVHSIHKYLKRSVRKIVRWEVLKTDAGRKYCFLSFWIRSPHIPDLFSTFLQTVEWTILNRQIREFHLSVFSVWLLQVACKPVSGYLFKVIEG